MHQIPTQNTWSLWDYCWSWGLCLYNCLERFWN